MKTQACRLSIQSVHFWIIAVVLVLSLASACRKENEVLPVEVILVNPGIPLRDIVFLNDSVGFVCGGQKNTSGLIYRTTDGGLSWQIVYENNHHCLYTIGFTDTMAGIAGGDSLFMLRSQDGGFNWQFYWLADSVPPNAFDRPAFRKMSISRSNIYIAGGENFKKGVFYKSTDKGTTWSYKVVANELTGISFDDSGKGWICGNGLVMRTGDSAVLWADAGFSGDFFSSVCFPARDTGYIACYSGTIYLTTDAGDSWTQVRAGGYTPGRTGGINCMISAGPAKIIAGGSGGRLYVTADGGNAWKTIHIGQDARILALTAIGGYIYLTTDQGSVCRIPQELIYAGL